MQKTVKAVCVFTLVFFVLSMAGSAATCKSPFCKMDAKNDVFTINACKTTKCFNVLANDFGAGKKIKNPGVITTAKGVKVTLKSNGAFCYTSPASCSVVSDSFSYTAVNKYGITDTATVKLKFKCVGCSKCSNGKCTKCSGGSCASSNCPTCA